MKNHVQPRYNGTFGFGKLVNDYIGPPALSNSYTYNTFMNLSASLMGDYGSDYMDLVKKAKTEEFIKSNHQLSYFISSVKSKSLTQDEIVTSLKKFIALQDAKSLQIIFNQSDQSLIQAINNTSDTKQIKIALAKLKIRYLELTDNDLLLSSCDYGDESHMNANRDDIKENTACSIKDEKIYATKDGTLIDTSNSKWFNNFVLSKDGNLFVYYQDSYGGAHGYILKGRLAKKGLDGAWPYCYSKPVALAGTIEIVKGKITKIDNDSGHYKPILDQIFLGVKYLHTLGVVSEDIVIGCRGSKQWQEPHAKENQYTLQEALSSCDRILDSYKTINQDNLHDKLVNDSGLEDTLLVEINLNDFAKIYDWSVDSSILGSYNDDEVFL